MFYHARKLDKRADIWSIVIDAEDPDVVVISSYASFQFEKDLLLLQEKVCDVQGTLSSRNVICHHTIAFHDRS